MGRKLSIKGKNVQCRTIGNRPITIKPAKDKVIVPEKTPDKIHEGYTYHKHSSYTSKTTLETKIYLVCKNLKSIGCPGKGEIDNNNDFQATTPHSLLCIDAFALETSKFHEALHTEATNSTENPKEIYNKISKQHPVARQFCPFSQKQSSVLRWRNQLQPPLPTHIDQVVETLACEQWLRALAYDMTVADEDSQTTKTTTHSIRAWEATDSDGFPHIVLGTPSYACEFDDATCAYLDATFDVVPNINGAYQLLTLMIKKQNKVLPVAWALMSRKTSVAYRTVLSTIRRILLPNFNPLFLMTDFETAMQQELAEIYPNGKRRGCFFHHCHAILMRRQRHAIMTKVLKHCPEMHAEACRFERDLMNLALLPSRYIKEAFEDLEKKLQSNLDLWKEMSPLFEYYKKFWIQRVGPAEYSVHMEEDLTNNALERYHRSLKEKMGTKPEIQKFLECLKNVQSEAHCDLLILQHGLKPGRSMSRNDRMKRVKLQEAWKSMGDLSLSTVLERKNKIREFLVTIGSATILSRGTPKIPIKNRLDLRGFHTDLVHGENGIKKDKRTCVQAETALGSCLDELYIPSSEIASPTERMKPRIVEDVILKKRIIVCDPSETITFFDEANFINEIECSSEQQETDLVDANLEHTNIVDCEMRSPTPTSPVTLISTYPVSPLSTVSGMILDVPHTDHSYSSKENRSPQPILNLEKKSRMVKQVISTINYNSLKPVVLQNRALTSLNSLPPIHKHLKSAAITCEAPYSPPTQVLPKRLGKIQCARFPANTSKPLKRIEKSRRDTILCIKSPPKT